MLRGVKDRDIVAREREILRPFRLGIRAIIGEGIRAVYREPAPFNLRLQCYQRERGGGRKGGICLLDLSKVAFSPNVRFSSTSSWEEAAIKRGMNCVNLDVKIAIDQD